MSCAAVMLKSSDYMEQCWMMRETHVLVTSIDAQKLIFLTNTYEWEFLCLVALEFCMQVSSSTKENKDIC